MFGVEQDFRGKGKLTGLTPESMDNIYRLIKRIIFSRRLKAPITVFGAFTYKCNLHCSHCYQKAGPPLKDEMNTQEALAVIEDLARSGTSNLSISGGEVFLRDDAFQLVEYAASLKMRTLVVSNGYTVTEDVMRTLKRSGLDYMAISIDSMDPQVHDTFRGKPHSLERAVRAVHATTEAGLVSSVRTTALKFNYKDIPQLFTWCIDNNVDEFVLFHGVKVGRANSIQDQLLPFTDFLKMGYILKEYEKKIKNLRVFIPRGGIPYIICSLPHGLSSEAYMPFSLSGLIMTNSCLAGYNVLLLPNGDIAPCSYYPYPVANLKEVPIKEAYQNPLLSALRERKVKGPCSTCKDRLECGGCRSKAYIHFNDVLQSDPDCPLTGINARATGGR
ncbi:MAG: radical SAM protein [Theionarchaea archaeon]|nr:radical SAM protein [Theionarchaea archaeon]MBU7001621.1 radical SAM protein [Theionarchaea archaeon]MBU7021060.1 radical SAM protein [Theionarchaea archaeon]